MTEINEELQGSKAPSAEDTATAANAKPSRIAHARQRLHHSADKIRPALERPMVGAGVVGGLVAAAAGLWGPTEAALGALVGFVAYRLLKRRRAIKVSEPESQPREPVGGQPATGFAG